MRALVLGVPVSLRSMLPVLDPRADWREAAACRGVDAELFFATDDASQREAMGICGGCPVRSECLEHALTHREPYGVWGGTLEHERRRLARARSRRVA